MRRSPHAAAVVLLWLAVLAFAFHGCGSRLLLGCGSLVRRNPAVSLPRKMLLAVTSFDASSTTTTTDRQLQQQHHHHHHHRQHHRHGRWNRQGIPPSADQSAGKGEEVDPRYGVQKRLVPTGPNPLHH